MESRENESAVLLLMHSWCVVLEARTMRSSQHSLSAFSGLWARNGAKSFTCSNLSLTAGFVGKVLLYINPILRVGECRLGEVEGLA